MVQKNIDIFLLWVYNLLNFIERNRWGGDQSNYARTESPGRWEPGRKADCQMDRWGHSQRGDPSILWREGIRQLPGICQYLSEGTKILWIKVAPRNDRQELSEQFVCGISNFIPSLTEVKFCQGRFLFPRETVMYEGKTFPMRQRTLSKDHTFAKKVIKFRENGI